MRIGIDATPLPPNPVGAGNYIIQLVRAIAAVPTPHQFVIFAQPYQRKLIGDLMDVEWVDISKKSPGVRLIWEQIQLPGLSRALHLDLLHSLHYTHPVRLACPSVVTFHDMTFFLYPRYHSLLKRTFFPMMMTYSARSARRIIADSESTRKDAIRILQIPTERIVTVPLGVTEDYHPIDDGSLLQTCKDRYQLPVDFILFVGLIEPRKNLPLFIRAYSQLANQAGAPDLVLVGRPGWMYQDLYDLVKKLQLEDKVHFIGYVPAEDLPMIYNLARVFVYPSIYEGFGFPPLEAMACGTPVISTATSAMLETVGDAGLLVPPQDERALAQAIQSVVRSQSLREHYALLGRQQAAYFTWQRTAKETLRVYEQAA
jgi:glycosyltransferase involved in cell wall biosynthesis